MRDFRTDHQLLRPRLTSSAPAPSTRTATTAGTSSTSATSTTSRRARPSGWRRSRGHGASSNRGEYQPRRQTIQGVVQDSVGSTTYGGTGVYGAQIGGVWDALLGEGRNFWFFASSDWHNRGIFGPDDRRSTQDFQPGEYQQNFTLVSQRHRQAAPADDRRRPAVGQQLGRLRPVDRPARLRRLLRHDAGGGASDRRGRGLEQHHDRRRRQLREHGREAGGEPRRDGRHRHRGARSLGPEQVAVQLPEPVARADQRRAADERSGARSRRHRRRQRHRPDRPELGQLRRRVADQTPIG